MVYTSGHQSLMVEFEYNLSFLCHCHDLMQCLHSFDVLFTAAMSRIEAMILPDIHCATALIVKYGSLFFTMAQRPPSGPGPPQYQGFMITPRHTTLSRTSLDD